MPTLIFTAELWIEFLNFVISSIRTDEREFRLSPAARSGHGNLSRCVAFDFMLILCKNLKRYRYGVWGVSFFRFRNCVSESCSDILCGNVDFVKNARNVGRGGEKRLKMRKTMSDIRALR